MQNNFKLAQMAVIYFKDRRNSPLLLLTSKQITAILSQLNSYSHLSESP